MKKEGGPFHPGPLITIQTENSSCQMALVFSVSKKTQEQFSSLLGVHLTLAGESHNCHSTKLFGHTRNSHKN